MCGLHRLHDLAWTWATSCGLVWPFSWQNINHDHRSKFIWTCSRQTIKWPLTRWLSVPLCGKAWSWMALHGHILPFLIQIHLVLFKHYYTFNKSSFVLILHSPKTWLVSVCSEVILLESCYCIWIFAPFTNTTYDVTHQNISTWRKECKCIKKERTVKLYRKWW